MIHAMKVRFARKVPVSDAEYRRRMMDATADLYDALQRLGPGLRIIIDRQPDGQIRCADYVAQSALREIDTLEPVAAEAEAAS